MTRPISAIKADLHDRVTEALLDEFEAAIRDTAALDGPDAVRNAINADIAAMHALNSGHQLDAEQRGLLIPYLACTCNGYPAHQHVMPDTLDPKRLATAIRMVERTRDEKQGNVWQGPEAEWYDEYVTEVLAQYEALAE